MVEHVTRRAYVFRAKLGADRRVTRTIALAEEQTLEDLHELLRAEFGWDDPHLYSFWLDGESWGNPETEYTAPYDLEEGQKSTQVSLEALGLQEGQRIGYVFDFGDNWQVAITLEQIRKTADESYPQVLERRGTAPPQYPPLDDDEE